MNRRSVFLTALVMALLLPLTVISQGKKGQEKNESESVSITGCLNKGAAPDQYVIKDDKTLIEPYHKTAGVKTVAETFGSREFLTEIHRVVRMPSQHELPDTGASGSVRPLFSTRGLSLSFQCDS